MTQFATKLKSKCFFVDMVEEKGENNHFDTSGENKIFHLKKA